MSSSPGTRDRDGLAGNMASNTEHFAEVGANIVVSPSLIRFIVLVWDRVPYI